MVEEIIKLTLLFLFGFISVFIVFGLVLGLIQKQSNKYIYWTFGNVGLLIMNSIGTPIHEFSHYIMCKIFGHKVKEVKLYRPIESKKDGVLGYVISSSNPNSIYQTIGKLFVGTAPLFVGSMIIICGFYILFPISMGDINSLKEISIDGILRNVFCYENISTIKFWIFLFIAMSISTNMNMSKADIVSCKGAIIYISLLSVIAAIIITLFNINLELIFDFIKNYNIIFITILSISTIISLFTLIIFSIIYFIKSLI